MQAKSHAQAWVGKCRARWREGHAHASERYGRGTRTQVQGMRTYGWQCKHQGDGSEHFSVVVAVACVGCCSFLKSNHLHKTQDTEGKLLQTRVRHTHTRSRMLTRPLQTHHPHSRCHVSCAAFVSVLACCDPLAALGHRASHCKRTRPQKRTHEHNLCVRTNCRH